MAIAHGVGKSSAAFLYGKYFLELTKWFSFVIELFNSGGQRVELNESEYGTVWNYNNIDDKL